MNRRTALKTLAGAAGLPAVLRGRRLAGDKPNLLFLMTDEQRHDTFAAYGNYSYRMPNLNRLARECVVFDRCYTAQPVCSPNRSTIMTGTWPHTNGVMGNGIALRKDTKTLAEWLNDPDYRTAYFGKWHLGEESKAQHGFAEWVSIEPSKQSSYQRFLESVGYKPDRPDGLFTYEFNSKVKLEHAKPAFLATHAENFILANRAAPWALYVSFLEPHPPFYGPLDDLHTDADAPLPANYPGDRVEREPRFYQLWRERYRDKGVQAGGHDLKTREGWQRLARKYAGLCAQVDQAVGRVLWALEASGQADNTILVFTSDHGEMLGSHSLSGKRTFYEESIRVPMLLRVPFRHRGGTREPRLVSQIDLVPTLLDLMGKKTGDGLPGESWRRLLEGDSRRREDVMIEWHTTSADRGSLGGMAGARHNGRAIITPDGWKLGLYENDNCVLFHRDRDPLELDNLYYRAEHTPLIRKLRARIEAWQKEVQDSVPLPEPAS